VTGDHPLARVSPLAHRLRRLHVESRLGRRLVVAGDAVGLEDRIDVAIKVDFRTVRPGLDQAPPGAEDRGDERRAAKSALSQGRAHFWSLGVTRIRIGSATTISTMSRGDAASVAAFMRLAASAFAASTD